MRPLSKTLMFAGATVGLIAIGSLPALSDARFQALPSLAETEQRAQNGIVLIQSRDQRRTIDDFLEDNDFSEPEFVEKTPPRYFVEACRVKKKYLLMFSRNGEYVGSRKLGACEKKVPVATLQDLRYWLEDRNYTNIRFTKRNPPNRVAEACRDGRHYTIRFDAAGKGTASRKWFSNTCRPNNERRDDDRTDDRTDNRTDDRTNDRSDDRTGDREFSMSKSAVRSALRRFGYGTVRFDRNFAASKLVEACHGVRKFRLLLDNRARARARRAVGFCEENLRNANVAPPKPNLESLEDRRGPLKPIECQMVLNWLQYSDPIVFESADDTISRDSRSLLQTIADNVDRCPRTKLRIEGHTDSIGPARFNKKLSVERADAVRKYLIRRGVPRRRLSVKGFGEAYPVTNNLIAQDRARNRRIDLVLEWGSAEELGMDESTN